MNNMMQMLIQKIMQARMNPMAALSRRFNIPQEMSNNPQAIAQYLLDTGQTTQDQLNNAIRMKNDPQFKNIMK